MWRWPRTTPGPMSTRRSISVSRCAWANVRTWSCAKAMCSRSAGSSSLGDALELLVGDDERRPAPSRRGRASSGAPRRCRPPRCRAASRRRGTAARRWPRPWADWGPSGTPSSRLSSPPRPLPVALLHTYAEYVCHPCPDARAGPHEPRRRPRRRRLAADGVAGAARRSAGDRRRRASGSRRPRVRSATSRATAGAASPRGGRAGSAWSSRTSTTPSTSSCSTSCTSAWRTRACG